MTEPTLAHCPLCYETPGIFIRTADGLVCKGHA